MDTSQPITFRPARPADWPGIAALLEAAHLPLDGAEAHLPYFVVAARGAELVGCAGLERYGQAGLLRSVVVAESERGTGLGKALVEHLITRARRDGLECLVLLTETAAGFFPKFGFRTIARAEAPPAVLASVEFQTACPESAAVMQLDLTPSP